MKSNQKLKNLKADENAAIGMIITGALILILSIIIVPVFFRTAASTDADAVDRSLAKSMGENASLYTPAANATATIIDIGSSVMNLNPLAALVAVAGGIIGILLAVLSPRMFAGAGL